MISSLKLILNDDKSLSAYNNGILVQFDEIKRRIFLKNRNENLAIPDHYYKLQEQNDFKKINSIPSLLSNGLYKLAIEHLEFRGNRIYVQQPKQNEWQELITYIPPLVLQAAMLNKERPLLDYSQLGIAMYLDNYLLPNFKYTALPYPYIIQFMQYIEAKKGLHDLHCHLNGATETDIAWQDFLFKPDKIYSQLKKGIKQQKVKEQFEQVSHLLEPLQFQNLLMIAQRLRAVIFDFVTGNTFKELYNYPNAESLLNGIISNGSGNRFTTSYKHPFEVFTLTDIHYPSSISIEALMYVMVFRYLDNKNSRIIENIVGSLFHFYLLILGLANKLLVQQINQYGFEQFQKLTLNGLREYTEKVYFKRFLQMHGNELNHVQFLEGRFSPKESEKENIILLNAINEGWDSLKLHIKKKLQIKNVKDKTNNPELKLTAHFIKQEDKFPDSFIRHKQLRKSIWKRATVLALLCKKYSKYRSLILGIDAAASEFDASPEIFAPSFRMLRRKGFMHFTYHAGEDFYHVISGLRAIYEAVIFNEFSNGDRIGHATATGISVEEWSKLMGGKILIRQGEWLDNLIFAHHIIIYFNVQSMFELLPTIEGQIQKYAHRIYQRHSSIQELQNAWLMRKYCPILALLDTKSQARLYSVYDEFEWDTIKESFKDESTKILFHLYHSSKTYKNYDEIIEINLDNELKEFSVNIDNVHSNPFNSKNLKKLQLAILAFLHDKEIVIETLPTSNIRIGSHKNFKTYHLWNWMQWEKEGCMIPPIVVGTDDTGIFATNIYNEYANIYCYLTNNGKSSHNEAMLIIEKLDKNGQTYKFV